MDNEERSISHNDIYLQLGKLQGLMEAMTSNVSNFNGSLKAIHERIDTMEDRQIKIEGSLSSSNGATSSLVSLGRDFAIPILAIFIAWLVGKDSIRIEKPTGIQPEKGRIERIYSTR